MEVIKMEYNEEKDNYQRAVLELSPVIENVPYLLTSRSLVGSVGSTKGSTSTSSHSSNCSSASKSGGNCVGGKCKANSSPMLAERT